MQELFQYLEISGGKPPRHKLYYYILLLSKEVDLKKTSPKISFLKKEHVENTKCLGLSSPSMSIDQLAKVVKHIFHDVANLVVEEPNRQEHSLIITVPGVSIEGVFERIQANPNFRVAQEKATG